MGTSPSDGRRPTWSVRVVRGEHADVPVERARSRITAFVYGNILVLAAIAVTTPADVADARAVAVVLGTTISTYLAHVVAHLVGDAIGADRSRPRPRGEVGTDLRDALPIVSSGSLPVLVLLVASLADLDGGRAIVAAAASVVVRLAGMALLVARLSGYPPSFRQLVSGVLLAAAAVLIVILKVTLTH